MQIGDSYITQTVPKLPIRAKTSAKQAPKHAEQVYEKKTSMTKIATCKVLFLNLINLISIKGSAGEFQQWVIEFKSGYM